MHAPPLRCTVAPLIPAMISTATSPAQRAGRGGRSLGPPSRFAVKSLPFEPGFRVYVVSKMTGMGAAVDVKELMSGTEAGAMKTVQRAKVGQLKLVTFARPYHIAPCIRNAFAQPVYQIMAKPGGFTNIKPDSALKP